MGGSKSKEAKEANISKQSTNLKQAGTPNAPKIAKVQGANISTKAMTKKEAVDKNQSVSPQESIILQIETIIQVILQSETLNFLSNDYDEFKESLSALPESERNGIFLRECHRAVAALHTQGDLKAPLSKMAHEIQILVGGNPNLIVPCVFMACLLTSFKVVMIPQNSGDTISLVDAIKEAYSAEAEDYDGSKLMDVIDGLNSDLASSLAIDLPATTFEDRFNIIKSKIDRISSTSVRPDKMANTCSAIQSWIYTHNDDVAEDPKWNSLTCALRTQAKKSLQGKLMDLEYCSPESLKVPNSILYNSFRFSSNINVSTLNFDSYLFLARLSNMIVQYYIEESTANTQMLKVVGDLTLSNRRVTQETISKYLPNFQAIIKKLASTSSESDLVNDYDMVVIYEKKKRFHYALKDDLIFDCNNEGNTFELKLYLSQRHQLFSDRVTIMVKGEWRYESTSCCSYLITAKPTDTLQVLVDKLKNIYSDESEEFLSRIFSTLRVSTKAYLSSAEHIALGSQASKLAFKKSTKLSDLLQQVRDADPEFNSAQKMVDLVFFLDLQYKDYERGFEPNNLENNVDLIEELPVKFELSNLFNLQMEIDGFKERALSWSEDKVMSLLPNMLYVDVENINRYIEVPREMTVKFLEQSIIDHNMEVSNSYRVASFVCKASNGTFYPVNFMPNTKDEIRGFIGGVEKISTLDKLKMEMVVGVVFQRKHVAV